MRRRRNFNRGSSRELVVEAQLYEALNHGIVLFEKNMLNIRNYDRLYGIIFLRPTKSNIESNENACYIMIATRNRLY